MIRLIGATGLVLLTLPANALDLPFSLGPLVCRVATDVQAEVPDCRFNLTDPEKQAACVVSTRSQAGTARRIVKGVATPTGWRPLAQGPDPFVMSFHGVTCWLTIPSYIKGYRCSRANDRLDCTVCLTDACYDARLSIHETDLPLDYSATGSIGK